MPATEEAKDNDNSLVGLSGDQELTGMEGSMVDIVDSDWGTDGKDAPDLWVDWGVDETSPEYVSLEIFEKTEGYEQRNQCQDKNINTSMLSRGNLEERPMENPDNTFVPPITSTQFREGV